MMRTTNSIGTVQAKRIAAIVVSAIFGWLFASMAIANAEDWPRFRKGIWQFERTLELTNNSNKTKENSLLMKHKMTRCVDPSESMKETFRPVSVGNCHPRPPTRVANKYVFSLRCDYMGPVRTTIDVQSDTAYIEVNELQAGKFPRTDTVIARRVAECD